MVYLITIAIIIVVDEVIVDNLVCVVENPSSIFDIGRVENWLN